MFEPAVGSAVEAAIPLLLTGWIEYILENPDQFAVMLREHLQMVVIGVTAAIAVAVPAGIAATRHPTVGSAVMNMGAIAQTVPPLGVIALTFAFLGVGPRPAILALFLYGLLPILKNTVAGIQNVESAQVEAGRGMGMTSLQRLWRIELPLALPVIIAGIRTTIVLSVGIAYLGAFIGAGGLGQWIILGQQRYANEILLAGAIPGAILVILLDQAFGWLGARIGPTESSADDRTQTTVA
ncbi:ABC transporter permease [Natrarchaeobius oligotrophus]|uniref:ABC transporter permease n=1 Tax=Natrarchaeobius chitinivorans TaxID=1679083 RepID=A0A3N6MJB0_NATCH|nr:ABC transporter permease [Natrarchaeobius chitinivorans]RQH01365.1 ABC transporter permease [Natrarchaeobius chitinivorans]